MIIKNHLKIKNYNNDVSLIDIKPILMDIFFIILNI